MVSKIVHVSHPASPEDNAAPLCFIAKWKTFIFFALRMSITERELHSRFKFSPREYNLFVVGYFTSVLRQSFASTVLYRAKILY